MVKSCVTEFEKNIKNVFVFICTAYNYFYRFAPKLGIGMNIEAWQQQQKMQTILSKKGTAKEKGTGLGLFLVKEIMDKNGGTLAIQSEKGIGTTVSVGLKKGK
jgi:two-component system, sensor histidine kinase and response regulator